MCFEKPDKLKAILQSHRPLSHDELQNLHDDLESSTSRVARALHKDYFKDQA